jgi:hypothetical protein
MNKTIRNVLITIVVLAILILVTRYLALSVNVVDLIRKFHGG